VKCELRSPSAWPITALGESPVHRGHRDAQRKRGHPEHRRDEEVPHADERKRVFSTSQPEEEGVVMMRCSWGYWRYVCFLALPSSRRPRLPSGRPVEAASRTNSTLPDAA
jgi:hypothetical protein